MSRIAVALCVLAAVTVLADDKYSSKYDNVNLEEVLKNDRLLNRYVQCLLASEDSKCTEDGKFLKSVLSDALSTDCNRCTEKQKDGARLAIKYLLNEKPQIWKDLTAKYDPTGEYAKNHPDLLQ